MMKSDGGGGGSFYFYFLFFIFYTFVPDVEVMRKV